MEKVARKPSADPIQEKLRQNKALWNKDVSSFINNFINFKKMINGSPSKYLKEKSKITDPIPGDPNTILSNLTNEFQQLVQRGNAVVSEQIEYSKNRKQKQVKPNFSPAIPTKPVNNPSITVNELSKQLSAFEVKYGLIVNASNPLSRFFTKLLNPTIGTSEAARVRRFRMSLLSECARFYKDLERLQAEVVKSSSDSIDTSYKLLHQCWNDWILIARGFNTYKINMPSTVVDSGGDISIDKEMNNQIREDFESEDRTPLAEDVAPPDIKIENKENTFVPNIDNILKDYQKILSSGIVDSDFTNLNSLIGQYKMSPAKSKGDIANLIIQEYSDLLNKLNLKYNIQASSLKEISDELKKIKNASFEIQKISQLFLKKWLGKALHHLNMFDKTSSYRLDIFKMAEEMRKTVDMIMNSLEKDMNVETLSPMINETSKKMTLLRGLMRALHNSHKVIK